MLSPITQRIREERGSVAALLPCAILIAIIGIGAFALDVSHNITVRSELQSATDAGALAGAMDLIDPKTERTAENSAIQVAGQNSADGKPVSPSEQGSEVYVEVSPWDNRTNSGTVTVDGTVTVNNMFAKLFGHASDKVSTRSTAQCWRSIQGIRANQAFPLMVSLDTSNGNQIPLYRKKVGDQFDIAINSQRWKNAAWTMLNAKNTNANDLTDAIDGLLGFKSLPPGLITGAEVGDDLTVGNGVMAQKRLAAPNYETVLTGEKMQLLLPVMQGDPPYNQNKRAVGFITVHVDSVEKNRSGGEVEVLHTHITKGIVKGEGGIPMNGNSQTAQGMNSVSAGTVQLIQ